MKVHSLILFLLVSAPLLMAAEAAMTTGREEVSDASPLSLEKAAESLVGALAGASVSTDAVENVGAPGAGAEPLHQNPANYDDLEGEEGLYWGDFDGSILGRVIDKRGRPIPYAKVKVHSKDRETTADKDGNFRLDGFQVGGHYSLIISARGKEPGVARWIPIPVRKIARIGDFSVEPEKVWTNFWVVSQETSVLEEFDALSNRTERVVTSCVSNYYDIVEGETNIYSYADWYFKFHLTYMERRVLNSLGITNVPLAKLELARRSIGFGGGGRPLEPELEDAVTNAVVETEAEDDSKTGAGEAREAETAKAGGESNDARPEATDTAGEAGK